MEVSAEKNTPKDLANICAFWIKQGITTSNKDATRLEAIATRLGAIATSNKKLLVAFLLLVAMPGAPSSVLAPSSDARSP